MSAHPQPKPPSAASLSADGSGSKANPITSAITQSTSSASATAAHGAASTAKPITAADDDEAEEGEISEEGEIVDEKAATPHFPAETTKLGAEAAVGTPTPAQASSATPSLPSPDIKSTDNKPDAGAKSQAKKQPSATISSPPNQDQTLQEQRDQVPKVGKSTSPAHASDASKPDASPSTDASATVPTSAPAATASTESAEDGNDTSSIQPAPAAFVGTTNADAAAEPDPLHPPTSKTASLILAPVEPALTTSAQPVEATAQPTEGTTAPARPMSEPIAEPIAATDQAGAPSQTEQDGTSNANAMDEDLLPITKSPAQNDSTTTSKSAAIASEEAASTPANAEQSSGDVEMEDASATAVEPNAEAADAGKVAAADLKDLQSDNGLDGVQTPALESETADAPQEHRDEESKPSTAETDAGRIVQEQEEGARRTEKDHLASDGSIRTPEAVSAAFTTDKVAAEAPVKEHEALATSKAAKDDKVSAAPGAVAQLPVTAPLAPDSTARAASPEAAHTPAEKIQHEADQTRELRELRTAPTLPPAASNNGVDASERKEQGAPPTATQPPAQQAATERRRTPPGQAHRQQQQQQSHQQRQQQPPHQHQSQQMSQENARASRRPPQAADVEEQQERERKSRSNISRPSMPERDRNGGLDRHQNRERRKEQENDRERMERERERERERLRESERDRELMLARENEEARLIWLSLPGNDHPQYYTDTDSDSCYGDGGIGMYGTDEEDKDLDPPQPLTIQEHYAPPSYGVAATGIKRKSPAYPHVDPYGSIVTRDAGHVGGGHAKRRAYTSAVSLDYDLAVPALPLDAQTRGMISIDDFPVIDSSIRGEPEHRPLFNRDATFGHYDDDERDDDDEEAFVTSDSEEEASKIAAERKRRHGNRVGNRGNKLSRAKGVRWHRRGKLGGWTEARMEKEIGDRVRHRIEALQKDNIRALVAAMPAEDKEMLHQFPALRNGLLPGEAHSNGIVTRDARGRLLPSDLSEAARIDAQLGLGPGAAPTLADGPFSDEAERLTSTLLAPTLLKPAVTARQLLTSHTLRHTFRNPHIGALGKTALDLIESEGVLGRAIGRCWSSMERGGWNVDPQPHVNAADDEMELEEPETSGQADLHSDGDTREVLASLTANPALQHLDDLFVTKVGLAVPRLDETGQPVFERDDMADISGASGPDSQLFEPRLATTLLPAMEQRAVVLAALECLHELAADSREYVERLEEVRSRLAAIKRRRAEVWAAVREWAIEKEEKGEGEQAFHPVHATTATTSAVGGDIGPLQIPSGDRDGGVAAPTASKGENGVGATASTSSSGASGKATTGKTTAGTGKGRKKTNKTSSTVVTGGASAAGAGGGGLDKAQATPAPAPSAGRNTVTSALAGVAFTPGQ